ncbi:MAG: ABC transporter ATP-binding protein [Bacillota bacterium]|nr:ABC transporter ATP-binding protein [Bacillota bacterium]
MAPGPGYGPSHFEMNEKLKEPKPKNIKEVPHYLKKVIGGTTSRLLYIFKLVWEAKPSLLFVMIFMAVYNGVMPLVGTLITANLLSKVVLHFTDKSVDIIFPLFLQFGYSFLNTLVNSLNNIITRISGEVITNYVKVKIMKKAKEVDVASFDMPDFYERLENANREAGMRPVSILTSAFELISRIISMVSYIVVLFTLLTILDYRAYVFFTLFVVLSIVSAEVSFYYKRQNFWYMRRKSKDRRQLSYYSDIMVNKDTVKEVRLFGLSDLFIGRYNNVFQKYFKGIKKLIWKEGSFNIVLTMLTAVLNAVLFYMIATNVSKIGEYTIYTGALNAISACVTAIIANTSGIYEGSLFIDNMILFMNEKRTITPNVKLPIKPSRHCGHTIELRNVSFSYPGTDRKVLKNINFTLEKGDTAVLVGLNGAGKTTLIKLITRLYDPTEGEIYLDGVDIRNYEISELYKIFGIIFQDFGKYAFSVRENIAFGQIDKEINEENIEYAAKRSSADQFINRLPEGYDTPLMRYFETDGIELSIGQWQKLSIARAFYSDSDILILDEPTASLDALAEQEIYNQFDLLRKDKTTVFVSHRLSSAAAANKIIVLKDGEIAEMGDHKTLMAQRGEYYKLFSTQAKRYISSDGESIREENYNPNLEKKAVCEEERTAG